MTSDPDVPSVKSQAEYWNSWNTCREEVQGEPSHRQRDVVCGWLDRLGRRDLRIMEVGCGSGWLLPALGQFGDVTANDIATEALDRAGERNPAVSLLAGDLMSLQVEPGSFDVIVALEVLSHVADQRAFIDRLADLLRPHGQLMLATQNRPVHEKYNSYPTPEHIRRWLDDSELRALLQPRYQVIELFGVAPVANRGLMRIVNSRKVNAPVRAVLGNRIDRLKERWGFGGTLMCLAEVAADGGLE